MSIHPVRLIKIDNYGGDIYLKVIDVTVNVPSYIAVSHTWSSNANCEKSSLESTKGTEDYTTRVNKQIVSQGYGDIIRGLKIGYNSTRFGKILC